MGIMSIPVRLSLTESCAAALNLAADSLKSASTTDDFLSALDNNHCLWLTIAGIVDRHNWPLPDQRLLRFVLSAVHQAGKALDDDHVETLIHINHTLASALIHDQDVDRVLSRAQAAWIDTGRRQALSLYRWLMWEIDRKSYTT